MFIRIFTQAELRDRGWYQINGGALARNGVGYRIIPAMHQFLGTWIEAEPSGTDLIQDHFGERYIWPAVTVAQVRDTLPNSIEPVRTSTSDQSELVITDVDHEARSVTVQERPTQSALHRLLDSFVQSANQSGRSLNSQRIARERSRSMDFLIEPIGLSPGIQYIDEPVRPLSEAERIAAEEYLRQKAEALAAEQAKRAAERKERRDRTRELRAAFRDASLTTAISMVTCGFELETQATDGMNWNDAEERIQDCRNSYGDIDWGALSDLFDLPKDVEAVRDGSVNGFEFRTKGGLTVDQFNAAAARLFERKHEIDTRCSFHIHLAVNGVEHRHGERLQQAMIEFLIDHQAEVPSSVLKRWKSETIEEYATPYLSDDKYRFVRKHRQGTWEFRCFGNVTNAGDAAVCLMLAIRALQHGYKVVTGQGQTIGYELGLDRDIWYRACMDALKHERTIAAVAAEMDLDIAA